MSLSGGTRLGPYEVIAPLGAGGMGEVYRARDTRLGREVAIKVLPQHLAVTPEARARFEREARVISQLNHPHICTVHDVGRHGDTDYLVLELLEGEELRSRLTRGPLELAALVALASQICAALERAHRAGIVHRDLKPGNIMLTSHGAKLLDFGLARQAGPMMPVGEASQSPTVAGPMTAEGTLVGTFQYMAPEQLEGREADARTDIWALGCILYELATGVPAFSGTSQASLIASIMTGQPRSVRDLSSVAPSGLEQVIRRCLEKRPEARPQSAQDVGFMLELVAEAAAGPAGPPARAKRDASPGARITAIVGALVLALTAFAAGRLSAPPPPPGSLRVSTLSQGTRDGDASVSGDGRFVAFSSVRQSGRGLWLMDMATQSEVRITDRDDGRPRFSADGGTLFFTRGIDGRFSLWRVPVLGGAPRLLLADAYDADPSPDGTRLAFIQGNSDSAGARLRLMVARVDGTEARELWSVGSMIPASPRWSPDGTRIAFLVAGTQNAPNRIEVVDVATGKSRSFPPADRSTLSNPAWDGTGHGLVVAVGVGVVTVQRGSPGRIFRLDTRSGRFQPLGWLETFPVLIDLVPDGRLVLSSSNTRQNLCELPLDARDLRAARWLTSGIALDRQPVYSPDGKSLLFSSNRGGSLDLWEVTLATGEMHRVTDDPADDWDPGFARDGRSIIWCSNRSGAFEIWTALRDGSAPRQVSQDSLDAENPSLSPDGRWVLYSSGHPRKSGLWRTPIEGGVGEWLLRTTTLLPELAPDGRMAAVITDVGTPRAQLSVIDLDTRRLLPHAVPLQTVPGVTQLGRSRFTPDGRAVVFVSIRGDGQPVLVRRPVSAWDTADSRSDTLFADARESIESFAISPDGRRAALSVVDWLSSLTIADGLPGLVPPKPRR